MLRNEIKDYLTELDSSSSYFEEHSISGKIREVIKEDDKRSLEDNAEIFAFSVYTNEDNSTAWNSYFGPMMSFSDKNGNPIDFPSKEILNNEIVDYWKNRLIESNHHLLKSRYADLIIEFSSYSTDNISIDVIKESINAHILLSQSNEIADIELRHHLNRALYLSRKYNQTDKITQLFESALTLENKIAEDDKPGLWGFVLEWFLLDTRFLVPADKEELYIASLEERRERLLEAESIWSLENATIALAKYYIHKKNFPLVIKVLKEYEDCIRNFREYKESSFGKHHYLQNLEEVYLRFSSVKEVGERLSQIQGELRNFRLDPDDPNIKTIEVTQNIPQERINEFVNNIFTNNEIEQVILKVVMNFFLRKEKESTKFDELNKKYVFARLVSNQIFDDEQRFIATLPPLDEAPELHFIKHCADNIQMNSIFLSLVLKRLKSEYESNALATLIKNSGLISTADFVIVDEIISQFWKNNYLSFIHIAVPFIESTLRRLFLTSGMVVSIENKMGGYDYKSMNALLEHEQVLLIFKHIFKDVGEDLLYSIRIIFTEKLGLNIRNKVAHGIYQSDFIDEKHSNQIILNIFILSLIKINE